MISLGLSTTMVVDGLLEITVCLLSVEFFRVLFYTYDHHDCSVVKAVDHDASSVPTETVAEFTFRLEKRLTL